MTEIEERTKIQTATDYKIKHASRTREHSPTIQLKLQWIPCSWNRCSKLWIKLSSHRRRKTKCSREFVFRSSRLPLAKYRMILSAASTALALLLTVPPIHLFKSTPVWFRAASSSKCSLQCLEADRIDSSARARRLGTTGTHGITLLTRSVKTTLAQAPGSRKFIMLISRFNWDSRSFYFFIPVIIQPKQCELFLNSIPRRYLKQSPSIFPAI